MKKHPLTYRAKEMKILAQWVLAGENGSVVGLAGCGRSNLLNFLCNRPNVLQSYLPPDTEPVALIPIDLNNLPADDISTFYRVILRACYWVRNRFDSEVTEIITDLYIENKATTDPFLAQTALHELLYSFQKRDIRVVLVLNRFDRYCKSANLRVLNTLRGLRDSYKNTLCFIVGMRQEVAYLSDPTVLGDMYELLDSHVCWVGAMDESDARNVVMQAVHPTADSPSDDEMAEMLKLTGNFPVLLKAIGDWWLNNQQMPLKNWRAHIAKTHSFDYRIARLWSGLTQEEQYALAAVWEWQHTKASKTARNKTLKRLQEEHGPVLTSLTIKGAIYEPESGGWHIHGDLLADYTKRVGPSSRGRIRIDEQTEVVYQGLTSLRNLPPLEDKLLRFLVKNPYKRHTYSALIDEIFTGDAHGVGGEKFVERTRQDLFPLVRNLRKKIEVNTASPRYIINWTGNPEGGYQFYSEGRPD
ncbi:hypothetical protein QUF63_09025 [Anaerolineales bacterium HSG25]|nr:hypothetical protein [Anaerolineales bacterium HSG25]